MRGIQGFKIQEGAKVASLSDETPNGGGAAAVGHPLKGYPPTGPGPRTPHMARDPGTGCVYIEAFGPSVKTSLGHSV